MTLHQHNHAVVIHGAGDVRVEDRPLPTIGATDVLVRVQLGGICGSDLSYYRKGAVGDFKVLAPMVLGHEIVGHVADAGSGVHGVDNAAHVLVDPSSPCGTCSRCREGRSNVCEKPRFLGSASTNPHVDGGFASYVAARSANIVPVASGIPSSQAVFAEPLAVTVHAINRAGGVRGANVLIVGAGPIGSLLAASASTITVGPCRCRGRQPHGVGG
jgi:L-idonate 5-dehydrogenase